jgi:hypothetical protein
MKKTLITLLLFSLAFVVKGQVDTIKQTFIQVPTSLPMDGNIYTPVMVNGHASWYPASVFERNVDTTGTMSMILCTDTIKVTGTYWISGYLNYVSGNPTLQWYCSYVNENGQSRVISPNFITSGDSNFSPVEKRLGPGVVTIQVFMRSGAGRFNAGARIKKVR